MALKVYASKLDYLNNGNNFVVGGAKSGKYNINFNASFDQKNSAGQPQIFFQITFLIQQVLTLMMT